MPDSHAVDPSGSGRRAASRNAASQSDLQRHRMLCVYVRANKFLVRVRWTLLQLTDQQVQYECAMCPCAMQASVPHAVCGAPRGVVVPEAAQLRGRGALDDRVRAVQVEPRAQRAPPRPERLPRAGRLADQLPGARVAAVGVGHAEQRPRRAPRARQAARRQRLRSIAPASLTAAGR